MGEMNSTVDLFNKSAISRESAYMHLKKIKQQNKSVDWQGINKAMCAYGWPQPASQLPICVY